MYSNSSPAKVYQNPTPKAAKYVDVLAERVRQWSPEDGAIAAFNRATNQLNRRIGYRADPSRRDLPLYESCVNLLRFRTGL